jgi:hypothetical protein
VPQLITFARLGLGGRGGYRLAWGIPTPTAKQLAHSATPAGAGFLARPRTKPGASRPPAARVMPVL